MIISLIKLNYLLVSVIFLKNTSCNYYKLENNYRNKWTVINISCNTSTNYPVDDNTKLNEGAAKIPSKISDISSLNSSEIPSKGADIPYLESSIIPLNITKVDALHNSNWNTSFSSPSLLSSYNVSNESSDPFDSKLKRFPHESFRFKRRLDNTQDEFTANVIDEKDVHQSYKRNILKHQDQLEHKNSDKLINFKNLISSKNYGDSVHNTSKHTNETNGSDRKSSLLGEVRAHSISTKENKHRFSSKLHHPHHYHAVNKSIFNIKCLNFTITPNLFVNLSSNYIKIKSTGYLGFNLSLQKLKIRALKITANKGIKTVSDCTWLPSSTRHLEIKHSPMQALSFVNCTSHLKKVVIKGNDLKVLQICQNTIEDLDISWNLLDNDGFKQSCENGTANVRVLKLHNNKLSNWSSCGWTSLVHLELQNNKLEFLDLMTCPLHFLTFINLSKNKLKLPPSKFPPKLTTVNLSHNRLQRTSHFNKEVEVCEVHCYV